MTSDKYEIRLAPWHRRFRWSYNIARKEDGVFRSLIFAYKYVNQWTAENAVIIIDNELEH